MATAKKKTAKHKIQPRTKKKVTVKAHMLKQKKKKLVARPKAAPLKARKPMVKAKSVAKAPVRPVVKPKAGKPVVQAARPVAQPAKVAHPVKPMIARHPMPVARPQALPQAQAPMVAVPARPAQPVLPRKLAFKVGELIVYPAHGVGKIVQIEEQEIAGARLELYIIDFEKEKLRLKVPTSKSEQKGMRKLADKLLIDQSMRVLRGRARIKRTMWSRRAQEYEAKINSGDLIAVAEVVRDLYRSEKQPEQSYSERQLFEQALERMAREIAAVKKIDDDVAVKEVQTFLEKNAHRNVKPEEAVPAEEAA